MYKLQRLLKYTEAFVDIYSSNDKDFICKLCEEYRNKYNRDYFRVIEVIEYVWNSWAISIRVYRYAWLVYTYLNIIYFYR